MNINFKEGLRRITKILIIGLTLLILLVWGCDDFSFNTYKFYGNTFVVKNDGTKFLLADFNLPSAIKEKQINSKHGEEYQEKQGFDLSSARLEQETNPFDQFDNGACSWDYQCNKWKRECKYTKTDTIIKDGEKILDVGIVKMPSHTKVILWLIQDLIIIFCIPFILYGIYLLFEFAIVWIIQGFKK